MTLEQLIHELKVNRIKLKCVSLPPARCREDGLSLRHERGEGWFVSYKERGKLRYEYHFQAESDGCRCFLREVLSSPTLYEEFAPDWMDNWDEREKIILAQYGLKPDELTSI